MTMESYTEEVIAPIEPFSISATNLCGEVLLPWEMVKLSDKSIEKVEKVEKEKSYAKHFRVFVKGKVHAQGLVAQRYMAAKEFGKIDSRPFVVEITRNEIERVIIAINKIPFESQLAEARKNYNVKLISLLTSLEAFANRKERIDDVVFSAAAMGAAMNYYRYAKAVKSIEVDYSWIKEYLTFKNVNSDKIIRLFKSNKIGIKLQEGMVYMHDTEIYKAPVKYNESTNEFTL